MAEEYSWSIDDVVIPDEKQLEMKLANFFLNFFRVLTPYPNNPKYIIGNYGTVYNNRSHKKSCIHHDQDGYAITSINGSPKKLHRLILETFNPVDNTQELQVNHIDGNKSNNVYDPNHDRVNLEWCTCQENIDHAIEHDLRGTPKRGEEHHGCKHTEQEIRTICEHLSHGLTDRQIAAAINEEYTPNFQKFLTKIRRKDRWKAISDDFPNITVAYHTNRKKK